MPSKRTKGLDLNLGQLKDPDVLKAFDQVKLFKELFDDYVDAEGGATFTSISLGLGSFKADVYLRQTLPYTASFPTKKYSVDGQIFGSMGWYRYNTGSQFGWVPLKPIGMAELFASPPEDMFIGGELSSQNGDRDDVVGIINNNPIAVEGLHNFIIFYKARD